MDLLRRGREGEPLQNKRVKIWAGSDVFTEFFLMLVKMSPLYKLRDVGNFFKLTGTANA